MSLLYCRLYKQFQPCVYAAQRNLNGTHCYLLRAKEPFTHAISTLRLICATSFYKNAVVDSQTRSDSV